MRVPIFEELILSDFDKDIIEAEFTSKKVGHRPFYISIYDYSLEETKLIIQTIITVLKDIKVHPVFPYPLYIITKHNIPHCLVPTAKNVEGLPSHFFKKLKRLKKKEMELLNKCELLISKINNRDLYEHLAILKSSSSPNKELYNICKENSFYTLIIENELA